MTSALTSTGAASWWGVPLVAGIFTILGVVGAQTMTWILDAHRTKRDDEQRWHTERRQSYAAFTVALNVLGLHIHDKEMYPVILANPLAQNVAHRLEEIRLIASAPVTQSAEQLSDAIHDIWRAIVAGGPGLDAAGGLWQRYEAKREAFIGAARHELGVDR